MPVITLHNNSNLTMRLFSVRLFLTNLFTLLILGCSSEPQPRLELTLIVDGKKQISESVKGDAIPAVNLKYKNLIDSFTDICQGNSDSVAERKLKFIRLKEYLKLEFQMNESALFTVASEAANKSPTDTNNSLEVQIDSNRINCSQSIVGTSSDTKESFRK